MKAWIWEYVVGKTDSSPRLDGVAHGGITLGAADGLRRSRRISGCASPAAYGETFVGRAPAGSQSDPVTCRKRSARVIAV